MKIFSNIPQFFMLLEALKIFTKRRSAIEKARAEGDYETERKHIVEATGLWGRFVCDKLGIELEIEGIENLPEKGPVVYVSNHQSYTDIVVHCAVLNRFQFGYIAKKELNKIPLYGKAISDIRSVFMDRDDPRESLRAINEGIDLINKGFSLLIFPEGTRSRCHEMASFKRGSLRLATKPKVPVVPITIDGTYKCYEESGVLKGAKVRYIIHPPVETENLDRKEAAELAEKAEQIVRSRL